MSPDITDKPLNIVLVEDDDTDVEVIQRRFQKKNIGNPIHRARDGIEALELLRGTKDRQNLQSPYVMLIDINMPRMNGIELLAELRADPQLKDSIAFILTSSKQPKDVLRAYDFQVAGYFLKDDMDATIDLLSNYWRINQFAGAPRNMR